MYLKKIKHTSRSRGSSIVISLIREVGIDNLVGEFVDVLILMVLQMLYAVETYNLRLMNVKSTIFI